MSDSDSDCDWHSFYQGRHNGITFMGGSVTIMNPETPLDAVFAKWDHISNTDKLMAGHHMKICAFWLPILLQHDESSTVACWASEVGLIEPSKDLSLKHIHKIEIVEAILGALVHGTLKKTQTKQMVWISNRFYLNYPEVLEQALQWLECTGEPHIRHRVLEFGHLDICFKALFLIFVQFFQYIRDMSLSFERTMEELTRGPNEMLVRRSEEMKRKGNDLFQKAQYDEAITFYTKALRFHPENHIIYGNRALCYIKSNNFLKALGDGKKATLIKPLWAKGHYRYCEALFGLREVRLAVEANKAAQLLCKCDSDGMKDLLQQWHKFCAPSATQANPKRSGSQKPSQTKEASGASRSQSPRVKSEKKATPKKNSKEPEPKVEKKPQPANNKTNKGTSSAAQTESSESKPAKSAQPASQKPAQKPVQKPAQKPAQESVTVKTEPSTKPKEKPKSDQNGPKKGTVDIPKALLTAVTDGHAALENLRSRNAEQAFSQALALVGSGATKVPGVSSIDVLLLQFGRVTALTQIGRPEELSEAVRVLDRIQASEERTFQCLVCLAYGRVYVKENRFNTALPHFCDALKIVKKRITPGILTWPLTSHVVPETQVDYLTKILENSIELCRFPPLPDAICRLENCTSSVKTEIYFTDPDFKGFVQLHCSHSCTVEYHTSCWKTLKTMTFYEKSEKEILHDSCLTPDCGGQINSIIIFGPTGLPKCKFEVAIPRPVAPRRDKVNQECTSLKKIKSKEERRLRRKQYKRMSGDTETISTETATGGGDSTKTSTGARLHFRDHVLLQISQHMELLRQERSSCVPALSTSLRPWLLLDQGRGNSVASRLLLVLEEPSASLGAAVELMLERRNRVWGRLLIQVLSDCEDLQPKVSSWAQRLDSAGLGAAQIFMEQYSSDLEPLDLSLLVRFVPVQELILEKLGSHPDLFSALGLSVTEYLRQSSPRDMRLFVWALEEHRQHYTTCHGILDHYFDMMDGLCSVIKKSEENNISSPNKSKNRGKKKKMTKPVLVLSGPQGSSAADDWDPGLMEDDSLSFLEQPFSVPPHLRQQVASFEQQYNRSRNNFVLEDRPGPLNETLYEYFSQILEEYGPLAVDDPLLVSELENFPVSSQLQIQAAGGLEAFLLADASFKRVGGCVGLARPDAQSPLANDSLDQLDSIDGGASPMDHSGFITYLKETFPTLPNPYDIYTDFSHNSPPPDTQHTETTGHQPRQEPKPELLSVAVNTEEIQGFEKYPGELNGLLKTHLDMERQMSSMSEDRDELLQQRSAELSALQEELSRATSSSQVTQKELALFQHKLEEEVKKDQKDKKEHQEQLRALRQELDALQQERSRMKKSIREKNSACDTRLTEFLELSNQWAAEKLSLEEDLKRCKDAVTRASRRSLAAQLVELESSRDQRLYSLHREMADSRAVLHRLGDVAPRFAHQEMEAVQTRFRTEVQELEKKISSTQAHYEQQIKELKSGNRLNDLPPVTESQSTASAPEPVPRPEPVREQSPPQPPAGGAAAPAKKPKTRKVEASGSVFDRAVEKLASIFPHISRPELTAMIQRLRSSSGSLHSLTLQDVVSGVSQLILDEQEEQSRARDTPPLGNGASAWQPRESHRSAHIDALNSEDPCIICHDDMSEDDMCVLECRHSFHRECIRSWLKEQSTCPTCRDHALLPEDFPALSSMSTRRH